MVPMGYEYRLLTDKAIKDVLNCLLKGLETIWPNVFIKDSDWNTHYLREWLMKVEVPILSCDIVLSSDEEGFEFVEEFGMVENNNGHIFFSIEAKEESPMMYEGRISGFANTPNHGFGEFDFELYARSFCKFNVVIPSPASDDDSCKKIMELIRVSMKAK